MKDRLKQLYRMTNPYFKFYGKKNILQNTILYESFFGETMSCGPYALFHRLLENEERYGHFKHIWAVKDVKKAKQLMQGKVSQSDVLFVEYKSKAYNKYLATAQYVINNVTFPQYFKKRKDQIYINTWHGIPLKRMGYDTPTGCIDAANTVRNFLQADYLLSPNNYHTKMYNEAYKLKNIFDGKILEEGQARTDTLKSAVSDKIKDRLISEGVKLNNNKIILYAPTWRGTKWEDPSTDVEEYIKFYEKIDRSIDKEHYQLLIKPHVAVYKKFKSHNINADYLVPSTIDTNEILSTVDVLISDYSSIFYDFLVTDRPIFFYCNDIEEYNKYRGTEDLDEKLPGPMTASISELANWLNNIEGETARYQEKYAQIKAWACPKDDGNVCVRILDIVLGKNKNYLDHTIREDKQKILFFLGSLRAYGITYSILSLLNAFDYNKYDVTLYIYEPKQPADIERLNAIPEAVRVLTHTVAAIGNLVDNLHFAKGLIQNYRAGKESQQSMKELARLEYIRMFGQSKFDYIVDYVGYSPLFAIVAANAPAGIKSIWQHNDMQADRLKRVGKKQPNKKRLSFVFGVYPEFDNIVSCSESVMKVNMINIPSSSYYTFVRNMIDLKRIQKGLGEAAEIQVDTAKVNFVTMGRMSPEKNQSALIRAFARLLKEHCDSCLYILGDGPMRAELDKMIVAKNIEGKVILTGNIANPFSVMKQCDCFILPSLHEGQPMVVLEARVLKLPLIISNFSTVSDCLVENGQLVIGMDEEEIYNGLKAFGENKVPESAFNATAYNAAVMKEFESAIRGGNIQCDE